MFQRLAAAVFCLCIGLLPELAMGQGDAVDTAAIEKARITLESTDADAKARADAATLLLQPGQDHTKVVVSILSGVGPDASRLALAQAITDQPRPLPPTIGWALLEHLDQRNAAVTVAIAQAMGRFNDNRMIADLQNIAQDDSRPLRLREAAVQALGWQRSKSAARILLNLIDPQMPLPLREQAFAALANLTGRDLGDDPKAWRIWWRDTQDLPPQLWRGELINNFVRSETQQRQELNYAISRLVQAQQALYRATPATERPTLISTMLKDPLEILRLLAVDLAVERLLDNQPIPDTLLVSLRDALTDDAPAVRARAALLLRDLNDAQAADRIARQLSDRAISNIETLRAYLRVIARMPRHRAVSPALSLLRRPELRADAAAALAASVDQGLLDQAEQNAAASRVRQLSIPRPSDAQLVTLLAKVGNDSDWQRMASWLTEEDAALREAAARAWGQSNQPLGVLAARASDPVVLPLFLDAAEKRGDDAETFEAVWQRRPAAGDPNFQAWRRATIALAPQVPASRLAELTMQLEADEELLTLAEQLLSARLTAVQEVKDENAVPSFEPVDLLIARANIRLATGEPTQAVADLDQAIRLLPKLGSNVLQHDRNQRLQAMDRARIEAQLLLGNLDSAVDIAKRPLATQKPRGAADPATLQLFVKAAQQRVTAQQINQARQVIAALKSLAGENPPVDIARAIIRMEEDLAAMTPATEPDSPVTPVTSPGESSATEPAS